VCYWTAPYIRGAVHVAVVAWSVLTGHCPHEHGHEHEQVGRSLVTRPSWKTGSKGPFPPSVTEFSDHLLPARVAMEVHLPLPMGSCGTRVPRASFLLWLKLFQVWARCSGFLFLADDLILSFLEMKLSVSSVFASPLLLCAGGVRLCFAVRRTT
jgi:hypothetical protein